MITITYTIQDEPVAVTFSNQAATWGVRDAAGQVVLAAGTALTYVGVSGGVRTYSLDVDETGYQLPLEYSVRAELPPVGGVTEVLYELGVVYPDSYAGRYTSLSRLVSYFGLESITHWSKLSPTMTENERVARIVEVIDSIENEIDEFLSGGAYTVPFESPIPDTVAKIATDLAAVRLYEARGLEGYDPTNPASVHKLSFLSKRAMQRLVLIKNGLVRLSATGYSFVPQVVNDAGSPEIS